jgi:uncharacterized protein
MKTATVLIGVGRYQDRWHDYVATGAEVARLLHAEGFDVVLRALKLSGVRDIGGSDLVVVNAGYGEYGALADGPEDEWAQAYDHLREYRVGGGAILALHAASNSLDDLPEWREWIGGHWVNGRSMHPPIGQATVQISQAEHPVTAGLSDFTLFDEMYSYQYIASESEVLVSHTYDDRTHPLVWATESDGRRALYDALGHDVRSFASPGRCELLRREVRWLVGDTSGT